MNLLKLLDDWLHGSSYTTTLVQANITTSGRAALVSAFDDLGNPNLEDSGDLFSLDTKMIMGKDVYNAEEIGKGQYHSFVAK